MRSFGMSLNSRRCWSANQTGPSSQRSRSTSVSSARVGQHVRRESAVDDLEAAHAVTVAEWQGAARPARRAAAPSSDAPGSSPTVPERWPLRPSRRRCSPGPRRTRTRPAPSRCACRPSPRPTSGPTAATIHCGAGFSCQSPTQPTGCTVNTTVASPRACLSFHCGSAAPTLLAARRRVSAQRRWWLTPSASVQRCQ